MDGFRYWDVIEGEPFPPPNTDESDPNNPLFYLKRALGWLDELGMKGLIDLHAAPGSTLDISKILHPCLCQDLRMALTTAVVEEMCTGCRRTTRKTTPMWRGRSSSRTRLLPTWPGGLRRVLSRGRRFMASHFSMSQQDGGIR